MPRNQPSRSSTGLPPHSPRLNANSRAASRSRAGVLGSCSWRFARVLTHFTHSPSGTVLHVGTCARLERISARCSGVRQPRYGSLRSRRLLPPGEAGQGCPTTLYSVSASASASPVTTGVTVRVTVTSLLRSRPPHLCIPVLVCTLSSDCGSCGSSIASLLRNCVTSLLRSRPRIRRMRSAAGVICSSWNSLTTSMSPFCSSTCRRRSSARACRHSSAGTSIQRAICSSVRGHPGTISSLPDAWPSSSQSPASAHTPSQHSRCT